MRLRSKLTSEICQKVGGVNGKMTQNWLKTCTFSFFLGKPLPLKKNEERYFIFYYKNRNTYQFLMLTNKNDFENMPENGEFRF